MMIQETSVEKFIEVAESVKNCLLLTYTSGNCLNGRPMSISKVDETGCLWFFSTDDSAKSTEINRDSHVYVTFASKMEMSYMFVEGTAYLLKDKQLITDLWHPVLQIWFPDGLNDPRLILIKIKPERAEFWDGNAKMIVLFDGVEAEASQKHKESEQGKIDFSKENPS